MKVWLLRQHAWESVTQWGPLTPPFVLGRSGEALVRLSDRFVSRRHCQIEQADGNLMVRDLNSTHGTFVNGRCVRNAVLSPGDTIQIGLTTLNVEADDSSTFEPAGAEPCCG